jgi:hypothetical protein
VPTARWHRLAASFRVLPMEMIGNGNNRPKAPTRRMRESNKKWLAKCGRYRRFLVKIQLQPRLGSGGASPTNQFCGRFGKGENWVRLRPNRGRRPKSDLAGAASPINQPRGTRFLLKIQPQPRSLLRRSFALPTNLRQIWQRRDSFGRVRLRCAVKGA